MKNPCLKYLLDLGFKEDYDHFGVIKDRKFIAGNVYAHRQRMSKKFKLIIEEVLKVKQN